MQIILFFVKKKKIHISIYNVCATRTRLCVCEVGEALGDDLPAFMMLFSMPLDFILTGPRRCRRPEASAGPSRRWFLRTEFVCFLTKKNSTKERLGVTKAL